jgi:hypothetical protein
VKERSKVELFERIDSGYVVVEAIVDRNIN